MFKRAGRGYKRPFCINPDCSKFTPEEKRGYYKKAEDGAEKTTEKKTAKKSAAKKTAARKTTKKAEK